MLDKTQLSFFPLLGGVYIVRIGELFSNELAQMIFDLLKNDSLQWEVSRLVLEGFVSCRFRCVERRRAHSAPIDLFDSKDVTQLSAITRGA